MQVDGQLKTGRDVIIAALLGGGGAVADAATVWDQTAARTRPTLQPVPEQLRTLITPEKTPEQSDMAAQITRLKKISEDLRSPRAAAPSPVAPSEATRYDQQNPRHDGPTLH